MADVSADAEKKIQQLQLMEQSVQNLAMQKQQFQLQQVELDSALQELSKVDEAYKTVGNIMILSKKEDLEKDLLGKKEVLQLRVKTLEKQEEQMREKAKKLQEDVMKEMK